LIALGMALAGCAKKEAPASPDASETARESTSEANPGVTTTNPAEMASMTDNATETVAAALADTPEEMVAQVAEEVVEEEAEPSKRMEEWSELFNNIFADGDFYSAGIPTEEGLRQAAARGVTLVISLLTDEQHAAMIAFDEAALLEELGVRFERISVTPQTFSAADVNAFAELMASVEGPVLTHCGSANRVGAMWAAYLNVHKHERTAPAIEAGQSMGLRSESLITAVRRIASE